MEAGSSQCTFGKFFSENCDGNIENISELSEENQQLLLWRSGTYHDDSIPHGVTFCLLHGEKFLKRFSLHQKKCCDPFNCHKLKTVKSGLRLITLCQAKEWKEKTVFVTPGKKLCTACRKKIDNMAKASEEPESDNTSTTSDESSAERLDVDTSLVNLGVSPIKLHSLPHHSRSTVGKRKLHSASAALKSKLARIYVGRDEFECLSSSSSEDEKENRQKAQDLDLLMEQIQGKVKQVNNREKIQILTLVPLSWPIQKVSEMFQVSEYLVRQSRQLLMEKGILSVPEVRKGKKLLGETVKKITDFYSHDDFSRIMPGKKDKVSIRRNIYEQKCLILCNLRELYSSFKVKYPGIQVGFSTFAALRPKQCILAGSCGTHSVCVCTIHQNVQLLLSEIKLTETYHDLIKMVICSDNRKCMLRLCEQCPDITVLKTFLEQKFEEYDPDDIIEYSQWVSTDRMDLVRQVSKLSDFIDLLVSKIGKLIPHSFVAKSQSAYLRNRKENLDEATALILMDFSENYNFVIQDEAQGYHWNHGSCCLHTAVIYYQEEGDIKSQSICVISDDLNHDVPMVFKTQEVILSYIKSSLPHTVRNIEYFTDGCSAQYKNCKNFLNLCYHEQDFFGWTAKWSFFATSHGKSPCDGIGAVVKRLTTKASLQRPLAEQITSAAKMYDFCKDNIKAIKFFFVYAQDVNKVRNQLDKRFEKAKTLPGTRSMHHFTPLPNFRIGAKRLSSDEQYSIVSGISVINFQDELQLHANCYIACVYDFFWYVGFVEKINYDEGDVLVRFMHPHGPAPSFYWSNNDRCEVPFTHILCLVEVTTATGRTYSLSKQSEDLVQAKFQSYQDQ